MGDHPKHSVVTTTPEEIEQNTGFGTGAEIARIEVQHPDGKITRFFVSLRVNKRDQIVCEVATNRPGYKTVSRKVTGIRKGN